MDLEDKLEDLKQRKQDLQKSLAQRKKEFVALQREKKRTLENQIRRAQYRISARERKQRTRQLILIGSVVKNQADLRLPHPALAPAGPRRGPGTPPGPRAVRPAPEQGA